VSQSKIIQSRKEPFLDVLVPYAELLQQIFDVYTKKNATTYTGQLQSEEFHIERECIYRVNYKISGGNKCVIHELR
jgi:hypothetical protein